jgi:pyruvate kinase
MRHAKIVATLGPASSDPAVIKQLFVAGADMFRLNFSHGTAEDHRRRVAVLRDVENRHGRPIAILADLQGRKLRVGTFEGGRVQLQPGQAFRLQLDPTAGTPDWVMLPHPEIFAALALGVELLLDDGKLRLRVERCGAGWADTRVVDGGVLSNRKGVNVPGVVLPLSALTAKDRKDLDVQACCSP